MKAEKLTRRAKLLITIAFVCALILSWLIPILLYDGYNIYAEYDWLPGGPDPIDNFRHLRKMFAYDFGDGRENLSTMYWEHPPFYGLCIAVILWQVRRILDAILAGDPFGLDSAVHLKRAGICCLLLSTVAFLRTVFDFQYYKTLASLLTCHTLLFLIFLPGFLLCMALRALLLQTVEENDLIV